MTGYIIALSIALLLVILFMLNRVQMLVGVLKKDYRGWLPKTNKQQGIALLVVGMTMIVLALWYNFGVEHKGLGDSASVHGVVTDTMFYTIMGIISVVAIITNFLLFYFSYKYAYKPEAKALYFPESNKLEIAWTSAPAVVLAILVIWGYTAWKDIMYTAPEKPGAEIEIVGQQFAWSTRYAGLDNELGDYDFRFISGDNNLGLAVRDENSWDDFFPTEIHLPVNKPALFHIRAKDVLHSVFAPHFRIKMDAVPGQPTKLWFTPRFTSEEMKNQDGDFKGFFVACTEVCGQRHYAMSYKIVVETQEEYDKWYAEQAKKAAFLKISPSMMDKVPANLKDKAQAFVKSLEEKKEAEVAPTEEETPAPNDTTAVADTANIEVPLVDSAATIVEQGVDAVENVSDVEVVTPSK